MVKQEYVLNMRVGKMPMIFLPAALLPGEDIWRAFDNFAKPAKEKRLGAKDTGNKIKLQKVP